MRRNVAGGRTQPVSLLHKVGVYVIRCGIIHRLFEFDARDGVWQYVLVPVQDQACSRIVYGGGGGSDGS